MSSTAGAGKEPELEMEAKGGSTKKTNHYAIESRPARDSYLLWVHAVPVH